jgi:hypothetical protein
MASTRNRVTLWVARQRSAARECDGAHGVLRRDVDYRQVLHIAIVSLYRQHALRVGRPQRSARLTPETPLRNVTHAPDLDPRIWPERVARVNGPVAHQPLLHIEEF